MNIKIMIGWMLCILLLAFAGIVYAEDFTFELTEAASFEDKTDNWSFKASVPQVSGMYDEDEQNLLNDYLLSKLESYKADYAEAVQFGEQSVAEGNDPHFLYELLWDVVTDSEDYFVFRLSCLYVSASATTMNEYFNLDKHTGRLLKFEEDAVTSPEQMTAIYDQIYAQMKEINDSGEGMFWLEDEYLEIALGNVPYLNHWYYNADGDLVITFDKYEVAPGAMGSPEFVISAEPAEVG